MKEAIQRIAAAYPQGREAEAIVVRAALAEYLQRHGYLGGRPQNAATFRVAEEEPTEPPPKKVMVLKTFKPPQPHPTKAAKKTATPRKK